MRIDVLTLFPEMFAALDASIPGRARKAGALELKCHYLRDFAINKYGQVDDVPFGGEAGMVLRPEPLKKGLDQVLGELGSSRPRVLFMSAQGAIFNQEKAKELAEVENILIICGHYKGVDQRFVDAYVDEELSVGDYVVSGGELPAMTIIDAVARLLPGVLGDMASAETDSFFLPHRLGWPVYTRPQDFEGRSVPEALVSGHHENIRKWRIKASLEMTRKNRPDLFRADGLTEEEKRILGAP
jgi:tRNA (guanine37-N1)-methyltransferase